MSPESPLTTLYHYLEFHARERTDSPMLLGVDGECFTFRQLLQRIGQAASALRKAGVTPGDCVATVLPEGPGAALAFLGVTRLCAAAPLNPAYSEKDFTFYLQDLKPAALLLPVGWASPAEQVAESLSIPVLRLELPDTAAPDHFGIAGSDTDDLQSGPLPEADAVALILHTSGTTSRPKMVPLTHANLAASMCHVARTLDLSPEDRGLNPMPLFHIHGLVGCLLSSIAGGGSLVCAPGFRGDSFFDWITTCRANWYSAVPTIHQAALAVARENPGIVADIRFRFIRSSSSALPPAVFEEMERFWRAPVIESYGMTEAAHQMASNPLGSGPRKAGSVGRPAGPEIQVMDQEGNLLEQGATGEIVIRGPNVTHGYRANEEANAKAFVNGWFRTGDQGRFDEEGYLFLTGRLKEMINRGGENIAPKEIDEALLEHPGVRQAVAFAIPHESLGEDLLAAVVAEPGSRPDEQELREFLAGRLAGFKVPSRILFLDTIPKGPTGKVQRIGLHQQLADLLETTSGTPESEEEAAVAETFSQVLEAGPVGREDNFFYLGGDSLKAQRVLAQLRGKYPLEIPPATLFRFPNPRLLGSEIARLRASEAELDELVEELGKLSPEEIEKLLEE